jgi:hypothetical protein
MSTYEANCEAETWAMASTGDDAILEADAAAPPKQHHSALRIFERLKAEHGYAGGYTDVKDHVQIAKGRLLREAFAPLVHPPRHAQVDFVVACLPPASL